MDSTENELIQQAAAGNRQAFGALVQRHQARVFQFIRRLHGSTNEAGDLTHETFIKA